MHRELFFPSWGFSFRNQLHYKIMVVPCTFCIFGSVVYYINFVWVLYRLHCLSLLSSQIFWSSLLSLIGLVWKSSPWIIDCLLSLCLMHIPWHVSFYVFCPAPGSSFSLSFIDKPLVEKFIESSQTSQFLQLWEIKTL